jgi:hypothetical protein
MCAVGVDHVGVTGSGRRFLCSFFGVNMIQKSDAEICREKGWNVGDVLEGDEGFGPTRILITAIGERHILAKELSHSGADRQRQESHWTVQARKWKKV